MREMSKQIKKSMTTTLRHVDLDCCFSSDAGFVVQ